MSDKLASSHISTDNSNVFIYNHEGIVELVLDCLKGETSLALVAERLVSSLSTFWLLMSFNIPPSTLFLSSFFFLGVSFYSKT